MQLGSTAAATIALNFVNGQLFSGLRQTRRQRSAQPMSLLDSKQSKNIAQPSHGACVVGYIGLCQFATLVSVGVSHPSAQRGMATKTRSGVWPPGAALSGAAVRTWSCDCDSKKTLTYPMPAAAAPPLPPWAPWWPASLQ